jgi:hypothetical protein
MNSTEKYIYNEKEISELDVFDKSTNSIELWIHPQNENPKLKVKEFLINQQGRIATLRRNDDKWTAYPPLNFEKADDSKKSNDFTIEEIFHWNGKGQLTEIHIVNLKTRETEIRYYSYEDGLLAEINSEILQKKFKYNSKKEIEEVYCHHRLQPHIDYKWKFKYVRNSFGQITRRAIEFFSDSDTPYMISTEHFAYNQFKQLTSSKTIVESTDKSEGEESEEQSTKFIYPDNSSDKIKSIIKIDQIGSQEEWEFIYDKNKNLIQTKSTNFKDQTTLTSYIRN